tara:strand:- start:2021 stop:2281 length:261 start_codon:yes stop_codon:yes gene_type:complete
MEFQITATIELTREVTGTINVKKQDVIDAGFCKAVEEGDSTAWYGYVADFLESEFESNEYGYYPADIEIQEDSTIDDSCRSVLIDW